MSDFLIIFMLGEVDNSNSCKLFEIYVQLTPNIKRYVIHSTEVIGIFSNFSFKAKAV